MHSPLFAFTDEELASLRIAIDGNKDLESADSFYDAIKADLDIKEDLSLKVKSFVSMIEEYRVKATYTPVHELLQDIIDRTNYEVLVSAQPYGVQRRANVELLISNALSFEKTSFKGLFHFVRYIEHIKVVQVDYGEAGTIDENADVVRIMSIHKSKGLEFPVVFVSGLSKQFNTRYTKGDLILDMDFRRQGSRRPRVPTIPSRWWDWALRPGRRHWRSRRSASRYRAQRSCSPGPVRPE